MRALFPFVYRETRRIGVIIAVLLMSPTAFQYAFGVSLVPPTFDLSTSSNLAGATNAVYTFHIENRDNSTSIALSMVIPVGYSLNPVYVTNKSGIAVMTGKGGIVTLWGGRLVGILFTVRVATTRRPGHYRGLVFSIITLSSDVMLTEPTRTVPGKLDVPGVSIKGTMWVDLSTVPGFLINPSTPGDYIWGPSYANSTSGQRVASVPRPNFTQKVTIVGSSVTTQTRTSVTASASSLSTSAANEASTTDQTPTTITSDTVVPNYETAARSLNQTSVIGAIVVAILVAVAVLLVRTKRMGRTKLEEDRS